MTAYEIFDKAEQVELLSAETYRALAARFAHDREARALFSALAAEELQHAQRVRLLAARYRHDRKLLRDATFDGTELDRLLREGAAAVRAIEAGHWGDDLAVVKLRVLELEDRCQEAHADLIARHGHPLMRDFFAQLAAMDEAHAELLGSARGPVPAGDRPGGAGAARRPRAPRPRDD